MKKDRPSKRRVEKSQPQKQTRPKPKPSLLQRKVSQNLINKVMRQAKLH